jgi:hypothetical protein
MMKRFIKSMDPVSKGAGETSFTNSVVNTCAPLTVKVFGGPGLMAL